VIELVQAKTGDLTIRFAGKFLASAYDPRAEAQKWADKVVPRVSGLKSVIVLGAGAGYQLEALKTALPHLQVICIEKQNEIVRAVKSRLGISLLGIHIQHAEHTKTTFKPDLVSTALKSSYAILRSTASMLLDREFYDQLEADLNGRTQIGFQSICEIRGRSNAVAKPKLETYSYLDLVEAKPQPNFDGFVASQIIKELVT
jgi:hypothetical protein